MTKKINVLELFAAYSGGRSAIADQVYSNSNSFQKYLIS